MNPDLEPLAPDIVELLSDVRAGPPMTPATRERLRRRLEMTAFAALAGTGSGLAIGLWAKRGLGFLARKWIATGVSVAVGAGAGAVGLKVVQVSRASHRPRAVVEHREPAPVPPLLPAPPEPVPPPPAPSPQLKSPAPPKHIPATKAPASPVEHVSPPPVLSPTVPLGSERALLERGRTALTRKDAAGALAAAEEHAARFPKGELVQEREALRIEALLMADRNGEARAAFDDFRRAFPESILVPLLEREIRQSIP
jgi:hypothetical protein